MAEIKNFPNNQDTYRGAEDVMRWFYGRTSGVFGDKENAAVSAFSTPRMAVQVSDGTGWIADQIGIGCVWWIDKKAMTGSALALAVDAADAVYHRIDRVIVEWNTPNYTDVPVVRILSGVFSSRPSAPALTNDSTTRQISLARIYVKAGATEITAADITDERLDSSVCGLVTERVNVDTSAMQAQFTELLKYVQRELSDLQAGEYISRFTTVTVTLSASGWKNNLQTVSASGVTADAAKTDVIASPAPADENYAAYMESGVRLYAQLDGGVQFKCTDVPSINLTVNLLVRR